MANKPSGTRDGAKSPPARSARTATKDTGKSQKAAAKKEPPRKTPSPEETIDEPGFGGFEEYEEFGAAEAWDDQESEGSFDLPARGNSGEKSKAASAKATASSNTKSRRMILIVAGAVIGLGAVTGGIMMILSGPTTPDASPTGGTASKETPAAGPQTEYDQLHAEWLKLLDSYGKSQNPSAPASEVAAEAELLIKGIQAKIDAAGPLNSLLPESQRKPADASAGPDSELARTQENNKALEEMLKMDVRVLRMKTMEFGIKVPAWMDPLSAALDAGNLTPIQQKLYQLLLSFKMLELAQ
ncbi:MAG: hypothetical protein U0996_02065 [Planctomycetaceae bacterium]